LLNERPVETIDSAQIFGDFRIERPYVHTHLLCTCR
jgi:hypothetical protein